MIDRILSKALAGDTLDDQELTALLTCDRPDEVEKLYAAARTVRQRQFGSRVYLYGFVYFSTYCKNNCAFCYYRRDNEHPKRYRKTVDEIVGTAAELQRSGVHLIDLTMGEDTQFDTQRLCEIIRRVKEATGLSIMVSPGLVSDSAVEAFREAGADWYALYQETHNRELYDALRLEQSYDARMHAKQHAAQCGLLIEEGLLTGVGDTVADTVHSLHEMKRLGAAQVRTMTFIPQEGTPMEQRGQSSYAQELRNIAVMRLYCPQALIPASLDVDGLHGLKDRLNAGANVVTSIIPPHRGFAGVANPEHDIEEGYRTVQGIQSTLAECGLTAGTAEEYRGVLEQLRAKIK